MDSALSRRRLDGRRRRLAGPAGARTGHTQGYDLVPERRPQRNRRPYAAPGVGLVRPLFLASLLQGHRPAQEWIVTPRPRFALRARCLSSARVEAVAVWPGL